MMCSSKAVSTWVCPCACAVEATLVHRFDLLCDSLGGETQVDNAFRDQGMTGREAGDVLGQRHDQRKLAELIDAVVRLHSASGLTLSIEGTFPLARFVRVW